MLDNKEILFTPKQKLQQGDNVMGIPLGIPQVSEGAHYLSIYLRTDTATAIIPIYNLQCMVDGRNLQGGVSSEYPHAEVMLNVEYKNVRSIFGNNQTANIVFESLMNKVINQPIKYFNISNNRVSDLVKLTLTKVAEETYFNAEDRELFDIKNDIVKFNGTMNFNTEHVTSDYMVKTPTETGILFSSTLLDSTDFSSISKLEVI